MATKKATKRRYIGMSPEAVAREEAEERKVQKLSDLESILASHTAEIEVLKQRVSVLEQSSQEDEY